MLATAARPDAVLDLTFEQCDIENRIINLNPTGREQTNKYRPTVRMPEHLVHFIEKKKQITLCTHIISYKQKPVNSIRSAWRLMRVEAGLDDQVQPYSLRHTMARWMRSQSVPAWEVSAQLGHKQPDMRTTEIYAPNDPMHLSKAAAAIDDFLCQLRVNCV